MCSLLTQTMSVAKGLAAALERCRCPFPSTKLNKKYATARQLLPLSERQGAAALCLVMEPHACE